jgi:hypothetical protein
MSPSTQGDAIDAAQCGLATLRLWGLAVLSQCKSQVDLFGQRVFQPIHFCPIGPHQSLTAVAFLVQSQPKKFNSKNPTKSRATAQT